MAVRNCLGKTTTCDREVIKLPVLIGIVVTSVLVKADNEIVTLIALCVLTAWGLFKIMSEKGY